MRAQKTVPRKVPTYYVTPKGEDRKVTLLATGSEVAVALVARDLLQAKGIPTAVVSIPSWELFEIQLESYRDAVLAPNTVRVAVEASVRLGWDRYIGEKGGFVGMASFGASGDFPDLYKHFGITPETVAMEAEKRL